MDKEVRRKMKKALTIIASILAVILLLGIAAVGYWKTLPGDRKTEILQNLMRQKTVQKIVAGGVKDDYEQNVHDNEFAEEAVVVDEGVSSKLAGYRNIALLGLDYGSGAEEDPAHSDTIVVLSIHNDTGAVRAVLIDRDTRMKLTGPDGSGYYGRIQDAYHDGGMQALLSALNTNLDLNITDYAVADFSGLVNIIDELGGIDLYVSDQEIQKLIALRHSHPIIVYGVFRGLLDESETIYAYERELDGQKLTVACNWTKDGQPCTLIDERMAAGNARELISNYSTHKEGILQPFEARVILG